ncbi:MAG: 3-ketoacyl-ACP reductase [Clostridia bacterium]|nr:3-ketoacyl-ACP reductase [Clostridia bacterium]
MKQTAVITGGSRGIGFAIARQLASENYNVAILDVNDPEAYRENLNQLDEMKADWLYYRGSVAEKADREGFVQAVTEKYGDIDVLVNNAGVAPLVRQDILQMTEESFDRVMTINLKGAMFFTQLVARKMLEQEYKGNRRGVIVNICSSSAYISSIIRGEYCMSKAGMAMMTLLYADRLAGEGINVYEIRPGVIDTDMTSVVHKKYSDLIEKGAFPIARWGTPQDIADAVSVFVSGKLSYCTGNYLDLDGGFHIPRL